jgi:hypothetical protein
MSKSLQPNLKFACLALLLVFALGLFPGPTRAAASSALIQDHQMTIFFLAPLVEIYEGDTISIPYMIEDLSNNGGITLAPLTPGQAIASAQLGSVSVTPDGLFGTVVYNANKAGEDVITLTASNYFGSVTATYELKVKPRPNYDLSFLIISEDKNDSGGAFRAVFSGEGQFANVDDHPIQGDGSSDIWFALWVNHEAIQCRMNPPITGHSPFKILPSDTPYPLASLVPPPGYIPPFTIDLQFEQMSLNSSVLTCFGLGDYTFTFDWPASQGNPDDHVLKGLTFPGEGGIVQITAQRTRGYVLVTRMD